MAPADDDFADARHVPVLYHGNLEDATVQLGEETGRGTQATGWYRILPRHSSRLTLEGRGPGSIPVVGAFTGSRLPSLHRIAERFSTVRFHADRGRMYRVRVDCAGGYVGDYTLDVSDGSVEGQGVHMSVKPGQTLGSVRHHGLRLDVGARRKVDVRVDHRDGLDATLRLTLLDHAPNRVMNVPVQLRRVTMGA